MKKLVFLKEAKLLYRVNNIESALKWKKMKHSDIGMQVKQCSEQNV